MKINYTESREKTKYTFDEIKKKGGFFKGGGSILFCHKGDIIYFNGNSMEVVPEENRWGDWTFTEFHGEINIKT